jgi:hypothetical protein
LSQKKWVFFFAVCFIHNYHIQAARQILRRRGY